MANYRQIHVQIWKDNWFIDLPPAEKLLFVYLFSNELAGMCGIYQISKRVIAFETGISEADIDSTLERFEQDDKVYYRNGIVWVKNMLWYNMGSQKNNKLSDTQLTNVLRDLASIPDCELKIKYIAYYSNKIQLIRGMQGVYEGYGGGIDRLSQFNRAEQSISETETVAGAEPEDPTPPAFSDDDSEALQFLSSVTSFMTIPATRDIPREAVLEKVGVILRLFGMKEGIEKSKTAYKVWCGRRRSDGKYYSKLNPAWLDWVIADEIPEPFSGNGSGERASIPTEVYQ